MCDNVHALIWNDACVVNLLTNIPRCDTDKGSIRRDKEPGQQITIKRPVAGWSVQPSYGWY